MMSSIKTVLGRCRNDEAPEAAVMAGAIIQHLVQRHGDSGAFAGARRCPRITY